MSTSTDVTLKTLRDGLHARLRVGDFELPLLPDSAGKVLAACNDTTCDARRLADLIQCDPSLAGNVLRIANSAAYAAREPIVSLSQAVSRLGLRTLCDITLAAALNAKIFDVPGREGTVREMWMHATLSAAWAREIARQRRRNVEGAFLIGLLHHIGEPVLLQALVEQLNGGTAEEGAIEACLLEFHADVGADMIQLWSLPEWMTRAVRFHHEPTRAGDQADLARMIQLADLLARWSCDLTPERSLALGTHQVISELGIYADEFEDLLARHDVVEQTSKAFA